MDQNNIQPQVTGGSSNKLRYIIGGVIIIIVIGLGSKLLFRGAVDSAIKDATGANVERSLNGATTYSNDEGSVTVGATSYPDTWPADAPRYPNGTINFSGSSNPQTGEAGAAVSLQTSDSVAAVIAFYKKELQAKGWTIQGEANAGGVSTIAAVKNDTTFGVYAVSTGSATQVTAGIGTK